MYIEPFLIPDYKTESLISSHVCILSCYLYISVYYFPVKKSTRIKLLVSPKVSVTAYRWSIFAEVRPKQNIPNSYIGYAYAKTRCTDELFWPSYTKLKHTMYRWILHKVNYLKPLVFFPFLFQIHFFYIVHYYNLIPKRTSYNGPILYFDLYPVGIFGLV